MFRFRDSLFHAYCWFTHAELTANSSVTEARRNLISHVYFLQVVHHSLRGLKTPECVSAILRSVLNKNTPRRKHNIHTVKGTIYSRKAEFCCLLSQHWDPQRYHCSAFLWRTLKRQCVPIDLVVLNTFQQASTSTNVGSMNNETHRACNRITHASYH